MKKFFAVMLALAGVMTLSTSCLKEEVSDVLVALTIHQDINAYFGLNDADKAIVKDQTQAIEDAFTAALNATRLEQDIDRYWIARNQRSNKSVYEMVASAGEQAYSNAKSVKPLIPITVSLSIDSMFGKETVADYSF